MAGEKVIKKFEKYKIHGLIHDGSFCGLHSGVFTATIVSRAVNCKRCLKIMRVKGLLEDWL